MMTFAPAMLSEIIDYGVLKCRHQNTAMYFSLYTFISKTNITLGTTIGLAIIGLYGYDATAGSQNPEARDGLILVMTWLPSLFTLIALLLVALNPINTHRYGVIRRRLNSLAMRAKRNTPVPEHDINLQHAT